MPGRTFFIKALTCVLAPCYKFCRWRADYANHFRQVPERVMFFTNVDGCEQVLSLE